MQRNKAVSSPEDQYDEYLRQAEDYSKNSKWSRAKKCYDAAIALKPDEALAYYYRAVFFYNWSQKDLGGDKRKVFCEDALTDCLRTKELSPDSSEIHIKACFLIAQIYYYENKNSKKAGMEAYIHAFYLYLKFSCHFHFTIPEGKDVLCEAIAKFSSRKMRVEHYKKCLDKNTWLGKIMWKKTGLRECSLEKGTLKKIRTLIAKEFTGAGDSQKNSLACYCEALKYDMEYGNAYLSRGNYFYRNHDFNSALTDYCLAVEYLTVTIQNSRNEEKGSAYYHRGMTYFYQGDYTKAILDFNQSLRLNPHQQEARTYLKNIFYNVMGIEKKKDLKMGLPGFEVYPVDKIYEDLTIDEVWNGLMHLSSEDRVRLFDESDLLKLYFMKSGMKYHMKEVLAKDYAQRGEKFYADNQFEKAEKDYESAVMLSPKKETQSRLVRIQQGLFFHPARARHIQQLSDYENSKQNAEKKTAHFVFPLKHNNLTYFFKVIEEKQPLMAFMEAYAAERYRHLLPGKVAPNKTYVDERGRPLGVSSKGIPGFYTFRKMLDDFIHLAHDKEKGTQDFLSWFESYISTPENHRRFIEILAAAFYRCEDDLHLGNIAIDLDTGVLYLFDTDCSMWELMAEFKGGRLGVDGYNLRNPATAFNLVEEDIRLFPYIKSAQPHYNPGRHPVFLNELANSLIKPIIERCTDNMYPDKFIELVQGLGGKPETMAICFNVWISDMLCGADTAQAYASLYLPADAEHNGKNVIASIVEFETKRNQEFITVLSNMPEFYDFLKADNDHPALYRSLLNCLQRNQKLNKAAQKYPERANELQAAMLPLTTVIQNYNVLVAKTNKAHIGKPIELVDPNAYLNKYKNQLETEAIELIDLDAYLNKYRNKLEKDLEKRETEYSNFFNKGKQKPEASAVRSLRI